MSLRELKVLPLNAFAGGNKLYSYLASLLKDGEDTTPDSIFINEVWKSGEHLLNMPDLKNLYKITVRTRKNRTGGGVAILTKKNMVIRIDQDPNRDTSDEERKRRTSKGQSPAVR